MSNYVILIKLINPTKVGDLVGRCSTLAALLEVSAYPKPGNVHRLRDYPNTRYEHFLAGSVAMEPHIRAVAVRAAQIRRRNYKWGDIDLGSSILSAVEDMLRWQTGGNVHLGVILLFVPLAAAAGASIVDEIVDASDIRLCLGKIIKTSTSRDSLSIFKSINLAMSRDHLGSVEEYDVTDVSSQDRIQRDNMKPFKVFTLCADRDLICSEWVTEFQIIFEEGYPFLVEMLRQGLNINDSTVSTFLKLLSSHTDSLIQRKVGLNKAKEVSEMAQRVLDAGGVHSEQGKELLRHMDEELTYSAGSMNPGTIADLTASSLFVLLLSGWRP